MGIAGECVCAGGLNRCEIDDAGFGLDQFGEKAGSNFFFNHVTKALKNGLIRMI